MSSDSWPPPLKEWVAKCLGQITDMNRTEVQAELKQVISEAFAAHTLWTTDWAGVQLKSLLPKAPPIFNTLKRKSFDVPATNGKKAKKASKNAQAQAAAAATNTYASDFNDQAALNRRAQRFQREHELEKTKHIRSGQASKPVFFNGALAAARSGSPSPAVDEPEGDPNVIDWDRFTIVGTCQDTFKDYLRLTSEPKPETIRPYTVLRNTLEELKERWKKSPKPTYSWICNQFKSLRQDLTVQRIKNEFTVRVYEIHARIALESSDMVEYNQCQATLRTLYDLGIPGQVEEFTAYRILMLLHGRNRSELNIFVGQLTPRQKANEAVQHALSVQQAQAMGNYVKLCDLYNNAPYMGAYIMDHFIDRERIKGLMVMTRAYQTITLGFIRRTLAFETLDDARMFLQNHQITTFKNPNSPDIEKVLACKPAIPELNRTFEEKYRKIIIKGAI